MKRTVLVLAIMAAFSITSVSQVCASPIAGEKAVTVSSWLSYYFAYLMRAHRQDVGYGMRDIGDDGNDVILRGDADDYANGKDNDGTSDPKDCLDDRNDALRSVGVYITGSGMEKIKY